MKTNAWIYYSIAAALFWGVWGVVAKLISEDVNPYANHVLFTLGMLFTLPLVLGKIRKETIQKALLALNQIEAELNANKRIISSDRAREICKESKIDNTILT